MSAGGDLGRLLANNATWARGVREQNPDFFGILARQQSPEYLWIGCSDSRVPANQITGLPPGEIFVHRNIANLVVPGDCNCLSVIQFAIDVLRVRHIIVCGHYQCGGVTAVLKDERHGGAVDHWLQHVRDVRVKYESELRNLEGHEARAARLCELNVVEQVNNVRQTPFVEAAWKRGQELAVHGWIYGVSDGRIRDLKVTVTKATHAP